MKYFFVLILSLGLLVSCAGTGENSNDTDTKPNKTRDNQSGNILSSPQNQDQRPSLLASQIVTCTKDQSSIQYSLYENNGERVQGYYICILDVDTTPHVADWNARNNLNYCRNLLDALVMQRESEGWNCQNLSRAL